MAEMTRHNSKKGSKKFASAKKVKEQIFIFILSLHTKSCHRVKDCLSITQIPFPLQHYTLTWWPCQHVDKPWQRVDMSW